MTTQPTDPDSPGRRGAAVKTRPTIYTADKVSAARRNAETLDWARDMRDEKVRAAQPFLDAGAGWLWEQVTTQGLPRGYAVNQALGSPITGTEIFQWGNYPWTADIFNEPWKVRDPSSGYLFPTNDFASFHASALDEHGNFHRELGDPQYLVNELYPERGPDWGVDDGFGWVDEAGEKWNFIAYYNHWFVWCTPRPGPGVELQCLRTGLDALREAFLHTGDLRYANAGIILLDRFADVYPDMDTAPYSRPDFDPCDGLRGQGKAIGAIWDNQVASELTLSYDAFFPAMSDDDPAGVLGFLRERSSQLGLAPKDTMADVRANIEHGILREIYPAVRDARICGNFGAHQATLARAAVVLDDPDCVGQWLDFLFQAGALTQQPDGSWVTTGGNVGPTLVNDIDRDGWYKENALHYNVLPIEVLADMGEALDGYDRYPAADIFAHPKYRALVRSRPRLTMLNRYTPGIGDSFQTGKPVLLGTTEEFVAAFERFGDPVDAQMAYLANGNSVKGLRGNIFSPDSADIGDRVQSVIDSHGPLNLDSEHQTGFGFAMHRMGEGASGHAMTLFHGSPAMHGHHDALALGLFAFGLDLMPGLGYPEFADDNAKRHEWENNTVSGVTTVVDQTRSQNLKRGWPIGYLDAPDVQYSDVEAPDAYPDLECYRRSAVLVGIDDEHGYIVDVFRIVGGKEHVYSFHTAEGPAAVDGVEMAAQQGGSYAGPDVTPPEARARPRLEASGFEWLGRVERGTPEGPFTVEWDIVDTYGVLDGDDIRLRLTMLNDVDDLALADGIPPRNKPGNPASLRYLLARRQTPASQFLSVIEAFRATACVTAVRTLRLEPNQNDVAAVAVELTDGRLDWIIQTTDPTCEVLVEGRFRVRAGLAVIRFAPNGELASVTASDLGEVRDRESRLLVGRAVEGTVVDRTPDLGASSEVVLAVEQPPDSPEQLIGSYAYFEDDGQRNAAFRIADLRFEDGRLVLRTDTSIVRGYVDSRQPDLGYTYDVEPGRRVRIPTHATWRPEPLAHHPTTPHTQGEDS